jgi:hypothetical protein
MPAPPGSRGPGDRGILENVYDKRTADDRIVVAQLDGAVNRHAGWKMHLTERELADAVTELREITGDRPDGPALMAEVAGLGLGAKAGIPLEECKARVEARILVAAGADKSLIARWEREGARRAARARQPPFGASLLGPGQQPGSVTRQAAPPGTGEGPPA